MKDEIQMYDFNNHAFRVIPDENDEPWFIAKDIADILEYSDAYEMTKKLDEDEFQNRRIAGSEFNNKGTLLINESGLYSSILTSRKPEAKKFKRWVTHEVLPGIRKNGYYQSRKTSLKNISPETLKQFRLMSRKLANQYLLDCGINPDWIKPELGEEKTEHEIVKAFWTAYQTIGLLADSAENPLNHSHNPETEIAINLQHFASLCAEYQLALLDTQELRRHLPGSQSKPLLCNKSVRSKINGRTFRCWVFKLEK